MINPLVDMIIFFTVFLLWLYISLKMREEFKSTSEDDWNSANEPKQWWLFIVIFGFWPIGLIFYSLKVRRKIMLIRDFRIEHNKSDPKTSELSIIETNDESNSVVKPDINSNLHYRKISNEVFDVEKSTPKYQV